MSIEEAIKILDYKINMYKEDVFIGDLDKTNIEAIKKVLKEIERLNNIIKKYEKMSFVHEIDLQNRIDKTIEYIKDYLCSYDYTSAELKEISDIFVRLMTTLRGEDNEI